MIFRCVLTRCTPALVLASILFMSATTFVAAQALKVLPEAGRTAFLNAFAEARTEIRIEICVLEDPQILGGLRQAIERGVRVRVIVDGGKYQELPSEQTNLSTYVIAAGGQVHLSNPIFPRSFPKVILIDSKKVLIGSACLDTTTFQQYRDYVYLSNELDIITDLAEVFENDWRYSSSIGAISPPFSPTPRSSNPRLAIGPVNAASWLTSLIQSARARLDVTSELLGNAALESELIAAARRGVAVRLISPLCVNGATKEIQDLQNASLKKLRDWGIQVHVTAPNETFQQPYMHARSMLVDRSRLYVGSISLSPNSSTFNREVGILIYDQASLDAYRARFERDYSSSSKSFSTVCPISP